VGTCGRSVHRRVGAGSVPTAMAQPGVMQEWEWKELLDSQRLVVTTAQLRAAGITRGVTARRLRRGAWTSPHRRVVVAQPGVPSYEQRVWAALLSIGGRVVASHETALWLADHRRRTPALVHVAVLDGRDVGARGGVRVHHVPDLDEARVLGTALPARVRVEHAVIDLGRACATPRDVVGLVTDVVGSGVTTADRLGAVLATRPRVRQRRVWEALLPDVAEGALSPLEVADLRNDRAHGLPVALRQAPVRRGGNRAWLDVEYTLPAPGRRVVKELDGRLAHPFEQRHRDAGRDNATVVRGGLPVRLGWLDVVGDPCGASAMASVVLLRAGWQGRPRAYGPGCGIGVAMRRICDDAGLPLLAEPLRPLPGR